MTPSDHPVSSQDAREAAPWRIGGDEFNDDGHSLEWSNAEGWTEHGDRFTDAERATLRLPIGGWWRREGVA